MRVLAVNLRDSRQSGPREFADLKSVSDAIPPEERTHWLFRDEKTDWMFFEGFVAQNVAEAGVGRTLAELPPPSKLPQDRRKHERSELSIECTLLRGQRAYTAYTDNISLGGLYFARALPLEMKNVALRVLLMPPRRNKVVQLSGRALQDEGKKSSRIAFENTDEGTLEQLQSLIDEIALLQATPKRRAA